MGERSEPRPVPLRLVQEFGETVELDGSSVYDLLTVVARTNTEEVTRHKAYGTMNRNTI